MDIQASGEEVLIRLSVEEAEAAVIDHGEYEVCLPVDDTLWAATALGGAIRDARAAEERNQCPSS